MNNENKEKEILTGINCHVTDCKFHNGMYNCTAPFINIKNKNSLFSAGTRCDTYSIK